MSFFNSLFTKKLQETNLLLEAIDLHSHILPGVDDGIQSEEKAIQALHIYQKLGYKKVVFTPHIMAIWPENNTTSLTKRFDAFKGKAPRGLELQLAAEYMLDAEFLNHLKEPLLSFDGKHVLVETSYLAPSPIMDEQLYELRLAGYEPILAHPERYVYMKPKNYELLKEKGLKFQLNLLSLNNAYGSGAKGKAEMLLQKGYYDFVGTDTHRAKWLQRGMDDFRLKPKMIRQLAPLFENNRKLIAGDWS